MSRVRDPDMRDPLTGLSNRRHFDLLFDFVFPMADRGITLSVALMELDRWEGYREERGVEEAEEVLGAFGRHLGATSRRTDLPARVDEGRILTLLIDCNLSGGLIYADRVREEAATVLSGSGLTLSVGLAASTPEMEEPEALLEAARVALGVARERGGDSVAVPSDAPGAR